MSRIIVTEDAVRGVERCKLFLLEKNAFAAQKASQAIAHHVTLLESNPAIGRPYHDEPLLRELIIPFGESGFVVLYHYEAQSDSVYLLAFRHQKEAGY